MTARSRQLRLVGAALLGAVVLTGACKEKPSLPPELRARYDVDAARLCNAIVDCLKADVSERLKDRPERRDMLLGRMTRDLCKEEQFSLIGAASVNAVPTTPLDDEAIYRSYSACSVAVAAADNCQARQAVYRNFPDCARLKLIQTGP
jgi:hypothetical protein